MTIDNLDGLFNKVLRNSGQLIQYSRNYTKIGFTNDPHGEMHCPKCGDVRKMSISCQYSRLADNKALEQYAINYYNKNTDDGFNKIFPENVRKTFSPSLWTYICLQCDSAFNAVIYNGPNGQSLAVHSSTYGGVSTPNTPKNVAFYLDQANRSHLVGASSAAMAMYRAALEQILYDQKYVDRMLGPKIQSLLKDIEAHSAPSWAYELDIEILEIINKIGSGSIHPNDGNISLQQEIDDELLLNMSLVFNMLLFIIYESSSKIKGLQDSLRNKSNVFKK